jgi:aldose 1-epimerase
LALLDSSAVRLAASDLEAVFLPRYGMLGASLRRRGVELLGRVENLEAAAESGSTAGIPLLHPWANRLAGLEYRAAGRDVRLDGASPILHFDSKGLPIHGVPWSKLSWEVTASRADTIEARLAWTRPELLAVFPFPHALELRVALTPGSLSLETTLVAGPLVAGPGAAVPVAFGFHPYFALPESRPQWRLRLPPMRRLELDANGIPTGREEAAPPMDTPLADGSWDDGFALEGQTATLGITGGDLAISVDFLEGFGYAQVYAPPGKPFVALEPMTAPTSALTTGRGLRTVAPGDRYRTAFRIRVEAS